MSSLQEPTGGSRPTPARRAADQSRIVWDGTTPKSEGSPVALGARRLSVCLYRVLACVGGVSVLVQKLLANILSATVGIQLDSLLCIKAVFGKATLICSHRAIALI